MSALESVDVPECEPDDEMCDKLATRVVTFTGYGVAQFMLCDEHAATVKGFVFARRSDVAIENAR